jgi:hypothetical protein
VTETRPGNGLIIQLAQDARGLKDDPRKTQQKRPQPQEFFMNGPSGNARLWIVGTVSIIAQGCTIIGDPQFESVERTPARQVYVTGSAVRHDVDPRTGEADTPDQVYVLTRDQFGNLKPPREQRDSVVFDPDHVGH